MERRRCAFKSIVIMGKNPVAIIEQKDVDCNISIGPFFFFTNAFT